MRACGSFADKEEAAPEAAWEGERAAARLSVFEKGQSKRIWGELYKVIDSSDVVVQVRTILLKQLVMPSPQSHLYCVIYLLHLRCCTGHVSFIMQLHAWLFACTADEASLCLASVVCTACDLSGSC